MLKASQKIYQMAGLLQLTDKNVTVVAEFPENTHNDISYPVAVIKDNSNQEVKKLYNFLISDEAKKIYEKYGFKVY